MKQILIIRHTLSSGGERRHQTINIGLLLLLVLLTTSSIAIAQDIADLPPQPDPICEITNYPREYIGDIAIFEAPDFEASVIGTLQQNETIESDGFIRIGNGVW